MNLWQIKHQTCPNKNTITVEGIADKSHKLDSPIADVIITTGVDSEN